MLACGRDLFHPAGTTGARQDNTKHQRWFSNWPFHLNMGFVSTLFFPVIAGPSTVEINGARKPLMPGPLRHLEPDK